jgi:hypothetical protein
MNWSRLYATFQIWLTVCVASMVGAAFWSLLLVGACRLVFGMDESVAMSFICIPAFLLLTIIFVRFLPKDLRKAGMLSDAPVNFGPWFK